MLGFIPASFLGTGISAAKDIVDLVQGAQERKRAMNAPPGTTAPTQAPVAQETRAIPYTRPFIAPTYDNNSKLVYGVALVSSAIVGAVLINSIIQSKK